MTSVLSFTGSIAATDVAWGDGRLLTIVSGSGTVRFNSDITVFDDGVLIVAGGGSGGHGNPTHINGGGGGGGGGVRIGKLNFERGIAYNMYVGGGGGKWQWEGVTGGDSGISGGSINERAPGGGGGGCGGGGQNGGSGGGGTVTGRGYNAGIGYADAGNGILKWYGNHGGSSGAGSYNSAAGGGGGGATGQGGNASWQEYGTRGGDGGAGVYWRGGWYGGGGGGGALGPTDSYNRNDANGGGYAGEGGGSGGGQGADWRRGQGNGLDGHGGGGGGGSGAGYYNYSGGVGGRGVINIYYKINNLLNGSNQDESGFTYSLNSSYYTATVTASPQNSSNIKSNVVSNNIVYQVTAIGSLYGDNNRTSIYLPNSVATLGDFAFHIVNYLTTFIVESNNPYFTVENGILFDKNKTILIRYPAAKQGNAYTIPSSVTRIREGAFLNCSSLSSIYLSNVITIDYYAFQNCTTLGSIILPPSIQTVGTYAFVGCGSLSNITIQSTNVTVGAYALSGTSGSVTVSGNIPANLFKDVTSLINVTIASNVASIGNSAFQNCTTLNNITIIPSSVTMGTSAFSGISGTITVSGNIPTYAFKDVTALTNVTIAQGVNTIGDYAFYNCTNLQSLSIPQSVTRIAHRALQGCTNLQSLSIPTFVNTIEYAAFADCWSLKSIEIPQGVGYIAGALLWQCFALTSVIIPSSVTSIEEYAFLRCSLLSNITINSSNVSIRLGTNSSLGVNISPFLGISGTITVYGNIPESAFRGVTALTNVTIASNVPSIGNYAFIGCSNITSIQTQSSPLLTSIGISSLQGCTNLQTFSIPSNVNTIEYSAFEGCSSLKSMTLGTITTVTGSLFKNCTSLTSVTIPSTVRAINNEAFFTCNKLTTITIPSSVTSIGISTFKECSMLSAIIIQSSTISSVGENAFFGISGSVTVSGNIPANAFKGVTALTNLTIASGVPGIGNSAFQNCTSLNNITIPSSVASVGTNAFSGISGTITVSGNIPANLFNSVTSLTNVTIGNGVTRIGNHAFYFCTGITSITIPSTVTSIDHRALNGCTSIRTLSIPSSVTTIDDAAIESCTSLTSITIPSSVTYISGALFYNCSALTSVTIPSSVTIIYNYAFALCNNLRTVEIPISVANIGSYVFQRSGVTSITIPSSVTTIGQDTFSNCSSLLYLSLPGSLAGPVSNILVADHVGSVVLTNNSANGITYTIANNQATVASYNGANNVSIPIFVTSNNVKYPVTSIVNNAFTGKSLTSVIIPPFITSIGNSAFKNNTLTSINLPPGLTSIGTNCFENNLITSAYFPSGSTSISASVFQNNRLVSINISPSLTTIGNYAFAYNYINTIKNSTNNGFPSTLTSIGNSAFESNQISNINIPTNSNFTTLADSVFSNNKLTSVTIPSNITTIGIEVFKNNSITSFTWNSNVTTIPNSMFMGNKFTSIVIPAKIVNIGPAAFSGCNSPGLVFNSTNTLLRIEENAFRYHQFSAFTSLPTSLTFIGLYAFAEGKLTSIIIPSNVQVIDGAAFYNNQITSVTFANNISSITYLSSSVFDSNKLPNFTVPSGVTSIQQFAFNNNLLTSVTIPSSVTSIGQYAFAHNELTPLTAPSQTTITSIGYAAFYNNKSVATTLVTGTTTTVQDSNGIQYSLLGAENNGQYGSQNQYISHVLNSGNLTTIVIPFTVIYNNLRYNITSIANSALSGKTLSSVTLNMNIKAIGQSAFQNNNLTSISIPNSVTSIGDSAFYNNRLTSVNISTNVSSLGASLFQQNKFTTITIPQTINSLGGNVFADNSLNSITIPSTITTMPQHAFRNNKLTSINLVNTNINRIENNAFQNNAISQLSIPSRITLIGISAFQNNRLTAINFTGTSPITILNDYVFADNSLNSITIPSSVTNIGNNALQNNLLTNIQLPSNTVYIGQYAFQKNLLQSAITIPSSVTNIGNNAFATNLLSNAVEASYNAIITFSGNNQTPTTTLGENIFINNAVTGKKVYITYAYGKSWASTTATLSNQFVPLSSFFESTANNIQTIIIKKTISPIIPSDQSKIYDGTIYINTTYVISGLINLNDDVRINGVITFNDKNVGETKPVIITLSLSGTLSSNYALETTTISTSTASIRTKTITPIITVNNKEYDSTTNASFTYNLSGIIPPDNPTLTGTATFSDSSFGQNKQVNITGLLLSGDNYSNYVLSTTTASVTANINKKFLYFSIPNKTYDGSSTILKYGLSGLYASDASNVTLSGLLYFSKATIGQDISVNTSNIALSGSKSLNYDASYLRHPPLNSSLSRLTGNIVIKALDLSYVIAKTYDTTVAYNNRIDLSGVAQSDISFVEFSYTVVAAYDVSAVTANKITISNIYLKGTKSANYSINQIIDVSGRILPKQLDISASVVKTYDGTANTYNNRIDLSGIFPVDNGEVNFSYTNVTYNDVNAGPTVPVTIRDISLNGLISQNYAILSTLTIPGTINKKVIDVSASAIQKTYDGTTDINCIIDLSGIVIGDTVYVTVGNSRVSTPNFGTYSTVYFDNFVLNGTKALNYDVRNTIDVTLNVYAVIRRKFLTSQASVIPKSYNGTTSATVTFVLNGVLPPDIVDVSNNYIANYDNANAGQNKIVNVSNITLYGSSTSNYDVSSTRVLTGNILQQIIDASCAPITKTYDGTTIASNFLLYLIGLPNITLNYTSAAFNNPFVGTNRTVNITGISINSSLNNYILSSTNLSVPGGRIDKRNLETSISATSKIYDNTNIAYVVISLTNKIQTDIVNVSYTNAIFDDSIVGENKRIRISNILLGGPQSDNYALPTTITITTGSIRPYPLNFSNVTGSIETKYYNSAYPTDMSAIAQLYLKNIIQADENNLSAIYRDAFFIKNPDVTTVFDNSKNLIVRVTGIDLSGSAKNNYNLNITSIDLSGSYYQVDPEFLNIRLNDSNINKIYDGTAIIDVSLSLYSSLNITPSNVFINYTTSNFDNKNVGTNKSIQINGIILSGSNSFRYKTDSSLSTLSFPSLKGSISRKRIDLSRNIITKQYDSNRNLTNVLLDLSGVFTGDSVTCRGDCVFDSSSVFGIKNVNVTNVRLIGDLITNYDISSNFDLSGQITVKPLTVSASKKYDASNTIYKSDLSLSGIIENEIVTIDASGEYSQIYPGNILGNIRNISLSGDNFFNYTLPSSINNIPATIYKKPLGITVSKVYDGLKTIITTNVSLNGILNNENVNFNGTGNFADASAGNNIPVTFTTSALIGNNNHVSNYSIDGSINSTNLTGTISRKPLVVSIPDIVYYGGNLATINDNSIRNSLINADIGKVRISNPSNVNFYYDSSQAGQRYINASGNLFITGDLSKNYSLDNTQLINATINKRIIILTVSNKIYNGLTNLDVSNIFLNNVISGDDVSITAQIYTDISNVGLGYVYINETTLNGRSYNNYYTNLNNKIRITILARPLTVGVNPRVYDGTTNLYIPDLYLNNTILGDNISVTATGIYSNIYAGTNKPVTLSNVQLLGTSKQNYSTDSSGIILGEIYRRPAVLSILPRIYDGSTNVYLRDFSLNNIVSIDRGNVSINGTGNYDTKNAGPRTAFLSGLQLSGSAFSNYDISATQQVNAVINPLPVVLSIFSKIYDTIANVNMNSVYVKNKIVNDLVQVDGNGLYDSSFVGSRSITFNNLSLYNFDNANYSVPVTRTMVIDGSITPHPLSIVVNDKIYDGTNIIYSQYLSLTNIYTNTIGIYPIDVSRVYINGYLPYTNSLAETNKIIDISNNLRNVYLAGDSSINYYIYNSVFETGNILPKPITIIPTSISKTYDTFTDANVTLDISGLIASDNNKYFANYEYSNFDDPLVGTAKPITVRYIYIQGLYVQNYTYTTNLTLSGDILPATLTVNATVQSKKYDNNNSAIANYSLNGILKSDDVNVRGDASFNNKNAGMNKTVTMTNFSLNGNSSSNYYLDPSLVIYGNANIYPLKLTPFISNISNKTFDGSFDITGNIDLSGVLLENDVSALGTFLFRTSNVENNKHVDISNIYLIGSDTTNYELSFNYLSGRSNIIPLQLIVLPYTKSYDGTVNIANSNIRFSGMVNNESIAFGGNAVFDSPFVGARNILITGGYLIGNSASNYIIQSNQTISSSITKRNLTIVVNDKIYDRSTNVDISSVILNGLQNNNNISLTNIAGQYTNNGNVGNNISIVISSFTLSGDLSSQYDISGINNVNGNIIPKTLTVSSSAANKLYDGLLYVEATLQITDGIIPGDDVNITSFSANFDTPDIGDNKTVIINNIQLGGTTASNYTVLPTTTTASVLFNPKIKYCAPSSTSQASCIVTSSTQSSQTNPNTSKRIKYAMYTTRNSYNSS